MLDEFKQAFRRYNNGHVQLVIINVVMYVMLGVLMVLMLLTGFENVFRAVHDQFSLPARFSEFVTRPWTLVTYMFTHDLTGILHILFNMLVLYWFGRLFVEYLGSDKLIAVYVLGGLAGGLAYLGVYNTIPFFKGLMTTATGVPIMIEMVGASAAVNAVVVAIATMLPNYTFFLLFFGPVRIKYIAAIFVFLSFIGSVGSNAGGNVAHLGGALIGFLYMKQLQSGINWGGWITVTIDWFRDLFKPRPKVKVTYRKDAYSGKTPGGKSSVSQDELDAILDKISAGGYDSLTKEEKEKLFNASKK